MHFVPPAARPWLALAIAFAISSSPAYAHDEPVVPSRARGAGDGEPRWQLSLTYQTQKTQDLVLSHSVLQGAAVNTHLVDAAVSYRIGDRWTINAGLPLISREWKGRPSHNPLVIIPPQTDSDFVDDNHYHTYLQDLRLGASYLITSEPIAVEPYIEYGIPASDYPFFGASAVGRQLQTIEVGTTLAYRPPFLQWYFSLRGGYQMSDKVLGYETDAVRVTVQASYFVNPTMSVNAFLTSKNGKGFDPPAVFDFTSELWYRHDQITRHNYMNLGAGVDWSLGSSRNVLNFTLLRMVHAEDVFRLRRALSVSLSRSF